jgi:tetratricopeptide (TPR) repeat protein
MEALTADPRNADRLNNLAVALFALGTANQVGTPLTHLYEAELASPTTLQNHAVELLAVVNRSFAANRTVRLNLAYFVSVVPSPTGGIPAAIPSAERALADNPSDHTARLLLGSLQARRLDIASGLDRAHAVLQPLLADPTTAPLGRAALADAHLAAASIRPAAPFLARDLARQALTEYDLALVATTDPGVFAGRATALSMLGAMSDAVAAQQRAVNLAPASVDFRLRLAQLQEAAGDLAAMRATTAEAAGLIEEAWNPPLASLRYVAAPASPESGFVVPGDRGYLGYSFGSDRDHASISRTAEGGAFVISRDLIPRTNAANLDDWLRTGFTPDVVAHLAAAAAIVSGPAGASNASDPAVLLAAGEPLPAGADPMVALRTAETALRHAGQFATAAALCQRLLAEPASAGFDRIAVRQCAGESAYLAGDFAAAAADLRGAYDEASGQAGEHGLLANGSLNTLRLRAAAASQAAGQHAVAQDLYTLVAADLSDGVGPVAAAAGKLGELALDAGDDTAATGWYDLVLAMVERSGAPFWSSTSAEITLAQSTAKRAHGNRGVARLRLAQHDPAAPPDCSEPARALCEGAAADFAAALAVDPLDPVFLLNAGWAARVLGNVPQARADLTLAAAVDPTLFPALNDLGVLAAEAGDRAAARRAFSAALAIEPNYDLAAWNLGVLDLQRGESGLLPGQAWLQRALAANPTLRGHDLAFKTDERVYRVTFGPDGQFEHGWSFGRSYSLAAVVLGVSAVVATLGLPLRSLLIGQFSSAVTTHGLPRLARGGVVVRIGMRRHLPRSLWRWWRTWEPWLLTLPVLAIVSGWTAWRANPTIGEAAVIMAVFAAVIAIAAHELGHVVAARWTGACLAPAQWMPGVGLALLLLPLGLSSGPFMGQRISGVDTDRSWWVSLAGPAANLTVAAVAYGIFLTHPLPLLRLVTETQLAAIAYSLLPFTPLDGSVLKRRPLVVVVIGLIVAIAGVIFAQGMG